MEKLYESRSYLRECFAEVVESYERNGKSYIRLDQSIFFPEEGGQYADTGFLLLCDEKGTESDKSFRLLDGQIIKEGPAKGEIVYETDGNIETGARVKCLLDWGKRFDRMQNHSGEHVLTGLVHNKYGYNNVGFHLSDDGFVTLDFDGSLSYEQLIEMEQKANAVIYRNLPIKDSYPDREALKNTDYRSKIEIEGQVRLITIGDENETVDVCACCAPHVHTTAEIGIIKVISVIKWKKGVQVAILCGRRALEYIETEHDLLTNLSRKLSTSPENVWNVVKSHMDEISELKSKLSDVMESSLLKEVEAITEGDVQAIFTETELEAVNMKNIYNALVGRFASGAAGVFVGNDTEGYRFNAGIIGGDARELAAVFRERLGAKGGGSAEMIQGRIARSADAIREVLKTV